MGVVGGIHTGRSGRRGLTSEYKVGAPGAYILRVHVGDFETARRTFGNRMEETLKNDQILDFLLPSLFQFKYLGSAYTKLLPNPNTKRRK